MYGTVFAHLYSVNHDGSLGEQLNNQHLSRILCKTYTDMRGVRVRENLHLILHFKKETVSVHELVHLSVVSICVVVV